LATQCSIDRIALLEELSKHWPGVISVALYLTDSEVQSFLDFIQSSPELRDRKNIAYHIVYKEGVSLIRFQLILVLFLFEVYYYSFFEITLFHRNSTLSTI